MVVNVKGNLKQRMGEENDESEETKRGLQYSKEKREEAREYSEASKNKAKKRSSEDRDECSWVGDTEEGRETTAGPIKGKQS